MESLINSREHLTRFEPHSHTHYSNLRLLDCINRPIQLIDRAVSLGLAGIAITDHETLSSHIDVNKYAQTLAEKAPDFKVALGNEIYLVEQRGSAPYYHFILIAKNAEGHRALREMSSEAWLNMFVDRGMERVVTTYAELEAAVNRHPNCLIATTACLGGELSKATKALIDAEKRNDEENIARYKNEIINFILFCQKLFKDDFYIECAPGCSKEQIEVNKRLVAIAACFNVKMVIGCDSHFLKKEDRWVHKAYLTSDESDNREVDSFYEYAYLQEDAEIRQNLSKSGYFDDFIDQLYQNSMQIYDKIENYSLLHNQTIAKVEVKDYPKKQTPELQQYEHLRQLEQSDNVICRYWINQTTDKLKELSLYNKEYLDRLEEEATTKQIISDKLGTNIFAYPVVMQHYINLFWECGSTVGAGRGSSCAGLNHYLLGVTQLDPIKEKFPWFRYLNAERLELPDIDLDLAPSKRPLILQKIKEERAKNFIPTLSEATKKNCGCTLVATFGTETTKSAILTACRGYRSQDYPDGIDIDTAKYLSSLVPQERGFLWTLSDVVYGNEEKERQASTTFLTEVNRYPGLLDIMLNIEGLIKQRGSHASGVILFDEDPYEFGCFMRTPSGEVITQYELHASEAAGMTKYDFLVTDIQDKIITCIHLLQEHNKIDRNLTIREAYEKYLHPYALDINNKDLWNEIQKAQILDFFQFDSEVGRQGIKKVKPRNIQELSATNGLIRLMTAEKGAETPMEKYVRCKNSRKEFEKEMDSYGLSPREKEIVLKYVGDTYGIGISQEQLMRAVMDADICDFSLKEANTARKTIAKKKMNLIADLKNLIETKAASAAIGRFVWGAIAAPQLG